MKKAVDIAVTGAAGQISYSLLFYLIDCHTSYGCIFLKLNNCTITHYRWVFIRTQTKLLKVIMHSYIKFKIHFHRNEKTTKTIDETRNFSILKIRIYIGLFQWSNRKSY